MYEFDAVGESLDAEPSIPVLSYMSRCQTRKETYLVTDSLLPDANAALVEAESVPIAAMTSPAATPF